MNQKELGELRRRFRPDKSAVTHIYGCYVNSSREIVSYLDEPMGTMPQEEAEKYLGLLKKALSGALGKNLIDIVFSTQQVADSDEHRLLSTLRNSTLKDGEAREAGASQNFHSATRPAWESRAIGRPFIEPIGSAQGMPQGGLCKPPARQVVMIYS